MQTVGLTLSIFLVLQAAPMRVSAEAREEFLYTIECAAAFLKASMLFQGKKTLGEPINGKLVELEDIDFWNSRSLTLLEYLNTESGFASDTEILFKGEMDSWLAALSQSTDQTLQMQLQTRALQTAMSCNESFMSAGWFN